MPSRLSLEGPRGLGPCCYYNPRMCNLAGDLETLYPAPLAPAPLFSLDNCLLRLKKTKQNKNSNSEDAGPSASLKKAFLHFACCWPREVTLLYAGPLGSEEGPA